MLRQSTLRVRSTINYVYMPMKNRVRTRVHVESNSVEQQMVFGGKRTQWVRMKPGDEGHGIHMFFAKHKDVIIEVLKRMQEKENDHS